MTEAVKETFNNRKTGFEDIVAFEDGFADDPLRQSRWRAFVKRKKPLLKISLEETIETLEKFMGPVADSIKMDKDVHGSWSHNEGAWVL